MGVQFTGEGSEYHADNCGIYKADHELHWQFYRFPCLYGWFSCWRYARCYPYGGSFRTPFSRMMLIALSAELGRWHKGSFALAKWYSYFVFRLLSTSFLGNLSDPVFFLLHSQLDRAWATWQAYDRLNSDAIAGGVDQDLENIDIHPIGTGMPVTKDTIIYMAGIGPDARVKDVLSTTGGYLCYEYAT